MSDKRQKSEMFSLRLAPDDVVAIRQAAAERGWSVSRFLREAAIRVATGPRCAECGEQNDLAWVVVRGEEQPTLQFSMGPVAITGAYRWCGWRCSSCCMRDYGAFAMGRGAS